MGKENSSAQRIERGSRNELEENVHATEKPTHFPLARLALRQVRRHDQEQQASGGEFLPNDCSMTLIFIPDLLFGRKN